MIFDYYYYYIIRYYDRKLNNTQQRLDFSSCFLVFVIPKNWWKQKQYKYYIIYVYLWSMCTTWHKLLQNEERKTKTVAMPKDIIINDYSKEDIYVYVSWRKTKWTYFFSLCWERKMRMKFNWWQTLFRHTYIIYIHTYIHIYTTNCNYYLIFYGF